MSKHKKVKYTKGPIGKVRIVPDFLPDPNELVKKKETVKVTLSLTKESIDFFKQEAEAHHTHYQKMIRNLLEHYAAHYRAQHKS
jgi:uncharacterized membrane-anchored protein YhcB (DUF1043 family)